MNLFFPILCVAAAGIAGYALEPSLRSSLIGKTVVVEKPVVVTEEGTTPPDPVVKPVPTPVPPVTPPPVVKNDPEPVPVPPVTPPTPEPTPPVTPDPPKEDPVPTPVASGTLSAEEIVKVMQESIKAAQVKEFTFEQVLGWKAGEDEEVDGTKYQTGQAAYKAETIFGVKTIQAKALITGGKVAKWIWPNSGMEIK